MRGGPRALAWASAYPSVNEQLACDILVDLKSSAGQVSLSPLGPLGCGQAWCWQDWLSCLVVLLLPSTVWLAGP